MIYCPYCGTEGEEAFYYTRPFYRTRRRIYRCQNHKCRRTWKTIEVLVPRHDNQLKKSQEILDRITSNAEDFLAWVCVAISGQPANKPYIREEMQEKLKKLLERS